MFSCFKCYCYFYLISLSHLIPFSYLAFLTFNPSHMLLSDWLKETSLCRRNFYFCNVLGQVSWCYLSFLLKLASSWAFFLFPRLFFGQYYVKQKSMRTYYDFTDIGLMTNWTHEWIWNGHFYSDFFRTICRNNIMWVDSFLYCYGNNSDFKFILKFFFSASQNVELSIHSYFLF